MLAHYLQKESLAWAKLILATTTWMGISISLLVYYTFPLTYAISYAFVTTVFLLLGFMLLEQIFKYFLPSGKNSWLIFVFPLFIASFFSFIIELIFRWIVITDNMAVVFLEETLAVRLFISWLIFTAFSLLINFYGRLDNEIAAKQREANSIQLAKEAELYHLRQQLQPHFLFNSLNSISSLTISKPEKAREMVIQLSEFLRQTIKKDDQEWLIVQDEIDYLKRYLDIEKVRFGHRLEVTFDIDESCEQQKIPPLLIQPLVENAVKHGLYGTTDKINIGIKVSCQNQYLVFSIENPCETNSTPPTGAGFGLEAVNRRLFLIFGRYDLLKLETKGDIYFATLKIPIHHV